MLCIQAKNWKDLLTDVPFARKDLIDIQDPSDLSKSNFTQFHYLKAGLNTKKDGAAVPTSEMRSANAEMKASMAELEKTSATWRGDHKKAGFLGSELSSSAAAAPKDGEHSASDSSMTHSLRFLLNSRTLMEEGRGCTDPLRRGVGAPRQCPLGVGSKLFLPLFADVRTFR